MDGWMDGWMMAVCVLVGYDIDGRSGGLRAGGGLNFEEKTEKWG